MKLLRTSLHWRNGRHGTVGSTSKKYYLQLCDCHEDSLSVVHLTRAAAAFLKLLQEYFDVGPEAGQLHVQIFMRQCSGKNNRCVKEVPTICIRPKRVNTEFVM